MNLSRLQPESWPKIQRFLRLSVKKAGADAFTQQSAALAFISFVSLIPLLATFSYFGARLFSEQQANVVEILGQILPYSEATLLAKVQEFLDQAATISGFGFAAFIVTSLIVFTTVEETVNRIWNVPRRRSLRSRLLAFTLVLFWGPLLIGVPYSLLFFLNQRPAFQALAAALPLQLVPVFINFLGLMLLYWLVPNTYVRIESALVGAIVAAGLLEALRWGFGLYIELTQEISVIYGSFGFVFFFMISIQLAWWIVLIGSEIAYCIQHFELLTSERRRAAPFEGSWLGLAAMAVVTEQFGHGQPITPHDVLAQRLELAAEDLQMVLVPLLADGYLRETDGETEGYLLGRDPYKVEVLEVLQRYEGVHQAMLAALPDTVAAGLAELRQRFVGCRESLAGITLAELVKAPAEAANAEVPA